MDDEARRARAEARRTRMVVRRTTIAGQADDLSPTCGAEAVSLVAVLTREAWALAGLPEPSYTRATMPVRFMPRERR